MTTHGHLWSSPGGTGLHAPYGRLVREDGTGRSCCHLCGRWFRALGGHVRVHGYTADEYRAATGLGATVVLASAEVTEAISRRQAARYRSDPRTRAALAAGQELARNGELGRLSAAVSRPQRTITRRRALERGRSRMAARRAEELTRRLDGTPLSEHLRRRYVEGASIDVLCRETGLGRATLRRAMDEAGIARRPSGATTAAGRRSRALAADREAARRVGTDDLPRWLAAQRDRGTSMADLATAVGHSQPWVRWRLRVVRNESVLNNPRV